MKSPQFTPVEADSSVQQGDLRRRFGTLSGLASPIDVELKHALVLRRDQLLHDTDYDLAELAHFVVVQPGDALDSIEHALGFPVTTNLVDGARFGDPDFEPSWEWINGHGGWWELAFVLSDDGFGHVLLVPDRDGVDPTLLALCRHHAA